MTKLRVDDKCIKAVRRSKKAVPMLALHTLHSKWVGPKRLASTPE